VPDSGFAIRLKGKGVQILHCPATVNGDERRNYATGLKNEDFLFWRDAARAKRPFFREGAASKVTRKSGNLPG